MSFCATFDVMDIKLMCVIYLCLCAVKKLLDSGVDPCCVDEKRRTPLHIAAANGNVVMGEYVALAYYSLGIVMHIYFGMWIMDACQCI